MIELLAGYKVEKKSKKARVKNPNPDKRLCTKATRIQVRRLLQDEGMTMVDAARALNIKIRVVRRWNEEGRLDNLGV
tara:strand:- start:45 stop:275 length:231 start_codon:yes stop_codon:yes gene_type:complete